MKRQVPFWAGLLVIVIAAVVAGFVIYGAYANTAKSLELERFMTISTPIISVVSSSQPVAPAPTSTPVVIPVAASSVPASSPSQSGVVVPADALSSPDGRWTAFETEPMLSWGAGFVYPSAEVEIVSSDKSIIKTFTPDQLYASSSCGCTVDIFGWGHGVLWLDVADSDQGVIFDFIKINTTDWSVTNYPTTVFDDTGHFLFGNASINLDAGKLVMTNLPWTPITDVGPVYSVWVYDIQTGISETIETTTAEVAASMEESTFASDLKWINNNTLQFYNFDLGSLATTTVSD